MQSTQLVTERAVETELFKEKQVFFKKINYFIVAKICISTLLLLLLLSNF